MVEPNSPYVSEMRKLGNFLGTALEYLGILFEFTLRAFVGVIIFGFVHYVMSLPHCTASFDRASVVTSDKQELPRKCITL
jgi:hypothetical protein